MGINPKSPLQNGLPLSQMTRKDQKQEFQLVNAELKEKLETAAISHANTMIEVAERKKRGLQAIDDYDEFMADYKSRLKEWMNSPVVEVTDSFGGTHDLKKNDAFTIEYRERKLGKFLDFKLKRELILNEISKLPTMPDMPEVGIVNVNQTNNNFDIKVDASGKGEFDATDDFEKFKKDKVVDAGT